MNDYKFSPEHAFEVIKNHYFDWRTKSNCPKKVVIGISGGKDSTVVAGIFTKILGPENVIGVSMPCNGQKDMADVDAVFNHLGIKRVTVDIGNAFDSIIAGIEDNGVSITYDTQTNLPARLRMSTLYAVAQSVNGVVLNTCNRTEDDLGYSTWGGDNFGSYAAIQDLTVTEVITLGDWLGLPYELVHKTPIDGLQPLTDEEKLGMKYADVDKVIRLNEGSDELKEKIKAKYRANKFKLEYLHLPGPVHNLPDYVRS